MASSPTVADPLVASQVSDRSSRATLPCAHCGLETPRGSLVWSAHLAFCCAGCQTVYDVIHGGGLDQFYRLRERTAADARPARVSGRRFEEFDDPTFQALHVRPVGELRTIELALDGVHCAACVWLVEKLPAVAPHVVESRLEFARARVRLTWDPRHGSLADAARALDCLGYRPHASRDADALERRRREDRGLLIRIGIAGALAGNVMLLAFALYGGEFSGMDPALATFMTLSSAALGAASLFGPGMLFFRGAVAALRTRTAHLDLPVAIGLAAGGVAGVVNAAMGRGGVYFDSLCVLVFLLLVGRWIQRRQQRRAADAVEMLFSVTPSSARVIDIAGPARDVPIEAVVPGVLVEARAGETIAVDGVIEAGSSSVDQSLLTGESAARRVGVGDAVLAGAVNLSGVLRVRATAAGEATRVGKLMRLVERGAQDAARCVRHADRIAAYFAPAMLALALLTAIAWAFIDPSRAIDNAAALLIVTCPCALGLATPLTLTVAIGRAARRGILIRDAATIETLARRGVIVIDKTGTLTRGRADLLATHGDAAVLPCVKAIEAHSTHPIATALVAAIPGDAPRAEQVEQVLGGGIGGMVDGRRVAIGSRRFIMSQTEPSPADQRFAADAERVLAAGRTPLWVSVDGRVVALLELGDPLREDARAAVDHLRRAGWRVMIASGDHPRVVAAVAAALDVDPADALGECTPEDKLSLVQRLAADGPVVMVGDGVNDAAALRAATIGVAVHGGAEASLSAAAVYLQRPGVAPLCELLDAGRRVVRVIRTNLGASLGYNVVVAGLAMAGVISPLIAAVLMPLSSLTVASIALGGRSFGDG